MNTTWKSIWAVVAGFLAVVVLSTATDALLGATAVTADLILALIYRSIYTMVGGYITAYLAPSNPMKHVLILAGIGFVAGVAGVVAGWNLSAHWYPILIALTGPLFAWVGGKFQQR